MAGPFRRAEAGSQRGFTLIETVLTISILVVMLGIVLSAMRVGIRSWEKGEAGAEEAAATRAIMSRFVKEAGSIFPYKETAGGSERTLFTGEDARAGFVTVSRGGAGLPWGGAKWVCYSLNGDVLTVREQIVPSAGVIKDDDGSVTELDGGVGRLSFEYQGAGGWEKSWNADENRALPSAIRVSISFKDGRKPVIGQALVGITGDMPESQAAEEGVR